MYPQLKAGELKVTVLVTWQDQAQASINGDDDKVGLYDSSKFDLEIPTQNLKPRCVFFFLLCPSQFHIYTHLCPMPDVPRPPIHTHVRFADRKRFASAKDTQWVRDRQRLEADKPANVNEIMLMDERGLLLEGMSSNFGVLVRHAQLPFSILINSFFPARMQFLLGGC